MSYASTGDLVSGVPDYQSSVTEDVVSQCSAALAHHGSQTHNYIFNCYASYRMSAMSQRLLCVGYVYVVKLEIHVKLNEE